MKKFSSVATCLFLTLVIALFAGCSSSSQKDPSEATESAVSGSSSESAAAAVTPADEASAKEDVPDLPEADPFDFTYFNEETGEDEVSIEGEELTADFTDNGLLLSGKRSAMDECSLAIRKSYDFGDSSVSRVRVDALAKYTTHIDIALYLDDEQTPFAEKQLNNQAAKKDWSAEAPVFIELPGDLSGKHTVTIAFNDLSSSADKKTEVLLRSIKFYKETLPTVYVNIDESLGTIDDMNSDEAHETRCYGSISITVPEGYENRYSEEGLTDYSGGDYNLDYIRGRGESTWAEYKKPYKIKLDEKANLFGMGSNTNWALIANFFDRSFIRNRITYDLGEALGFPFTPQLVPVEVVMNGDYLGLYYLSENVRVDASRVDIDNLEKIADDDDNITGGYLLSTRRDYWEEPEYKFQTDRYNSFLLVSPEDAPEGRLEEMRSYIIDYLNKTEDALFGDDFKDADGVSYHEYMDLESAAKYFLIQEFTCNTDGYLTSSTFLYKEKDGILYWGPLWDFDLAAWGDNSRQDYEEDDLVAAQAASEMLSFNTWVERMLEDPDFLAAVKAFWGGIDSDDPQTLCYQLNELVKDGGTIDRYAEELADAAHENADIPGNEYDIFGGEVPEDELSSYAKDFESETARLKRWIRNRIQWMEENIDQLEHTDATVTLSFYDGEELVETRTVRKLERLFDLPVPEERDDAYFAGWYADVTDYDLDTFEEIVVSKKFQSACFFTTDMTLTAKWIPKDAENLPEAIFVESPDIYITREDMYTPGISVMPAGSEDAVFYETSDPLIAYSSDKGELRGVVPEGEAVITVTTVNGLSAQYTVHISPESDDDQDYSLSVSEEDQQLTMKKGEYRKIELTVDPEDAKHKNFIIINGNEAVASMTPAYVITANDVGTAEIYIFPESSSDYQKITVTVTE